MAKANRKTLKGYFDNGRMPTERHFEDLVDSSLNIVDDGLNITEDGLQLAPQENHLSVIEFFGHILDEYPLWKIELDKKSRELRIRRGGSEEAMPLLTLSAAGKVKVEGDMEVEGKITTREVRGGYITGEVDADGKWHDITEEMDGICALRIIAACGRKGHGKYAVAEATAMHCFGKRRRIRSFSSWYGMAFNRIIFRWRRKGQCARLQVRTRCDYGGTATIFYQIMNLWHERDIHQ